MKKKNITSRSVTEVSATVYKNAKLNKPQILKDNNGRSGVYLWRNLVNKKIYIGSSVNLRARFYCYFDLNYLNKYKNLYICRALLKHGHSNFSLEILEYCDPSDVLKRENYLFELLLPNYNISKEPTAPMLGRKHSDKSKALIGAASLGRKHTSETKAKMSALALGRKGAT